MHNVCCLAGGASLIDDNRADLRAEGIPAAIRRHDTATLFDWLTSALSYQGISDQVAADYMERHGRATWADIDAKVAASPTCPKLQSYWHFHGCRYHKISRTCSEPDHIDACPLPTHLLRNGRLNQMAYSLFLFIRDIADGDLVGWIDRQFQDADDPASPNRLARLREASVGPLREVYGVSDKVLTMTLSCVLMAAPEHLHRWQQVGASMIAIDTLVHNFLVRTCILARFAADHSYGAAVHLIERWALAREARLGLQPLADDASAPLAIGRPSLGKDVGGDVVALDAERVLNDLGGLSPSLQLMACSSLLIYATLGFRFTAGDAGFLILIQSFDRPKRYGELRRFETIPSHPSLQA